MLKYWLKTNTHVSAVMEATQYLRSVRPLRRVVQRNEIEKFNQHNWPWSLGQELTGIGWVQPVAQPVGHTNYRQLSTTTYNYWQILFTDNRQEILKHRQNTEKYYLLTNTDNKTDKYQLITTNKIPTYTTYRPKICKCTKDLKK